MPPKPSRTVVFKPYVQNQLSLLPPSLDELVGPNHIVRLIHQVIEQIDIRPINRKYKGGGTSSYHPRLLLKILVYGYLNNVFSSRKLEEQVQQNIYYMWLCGMEKPDHNTINRFRSKRLSGVLKEIFSQVVLMLHEQGLVNIKETVFTDGTKIEANANRYTFVWGKSIKHNKDRIRSQLNDLWKYAQDIAAEELKDTSSVDFEELSPEKVKETVQRINKALEDKPVDPKVRQKLNYAKRHWPENLQRYQEQEAILQGRNSYSKTDPDATFMRMKEDHMGNGLLKPGYNWQISTQSQFILAYSLHHNPTDTLTLNPHLETYKTLLGTYPKAIVADAGYGSQENYELLQGKQITPYIKYNSFDKEQHKPKETDFKYEPEQDVIICPEDKQLKPAGEKHRLTGSGFRQQYHLYETADCQSCPLKDTCSPNDPKKVVSRNNALEALKETARNLLNSEQGIRYRKQRPVDVEPVFGQIKHNKGYRRFMLRGMKKVEVEIGLLAIAHNLRKWRA